MAKSKPTVTLETPVEELATNYPVAVSFLTERRVRCIRCGEPLWCTIGELFEQDNVENSHELLEALNNFLKNQGQTKK